jgi:hypothetical protein
VTIYLEAGELAVGMSHLRDVRGADSWAFGPPNINAPEAAPGRGREAAGGQKILKHPGARGAAAAELH